MIDKVENDYLFGLDKIKNKVIEYCKINIRNDKDFESKKNELGITPTFLFYGYPGTGKTTLANNIYDSLRKHNEFENIDKYYLRMDELLSYNFGESSKNLIKEFKRINSEIEENKSVAFIIIDELDFFTSNRYQGGNESVTRVLLTFNKIIDELRRKDLMKNMIIIATTNIRESIDTSILRRFFVHENFNINLDKEDFCKYIDYLNDVAGLEKINDDLAINEIFNVYEKKKFTLGEIKSIFANLYMIGKSEGKKLRLDANILDGQSSYNETINIQQGCANNER